MGQKRILLVDLSQEEEEQQQKASFKTVKKSAKKAMQTGKGAGRLIDKGESIEDIVLPEEIAKSEEIANSKSVKLKEKPEESEEPETKKPKAKRERGRRYKYARSMVDKTITYPLEQAMELVKKTSITRFDGTLTAHLNLNEEKFTKEVKFPHSTGRETRVAIADEKTLKKVEKGLMDFDVLVATPIQMKNVTKVAKILGPKGLMPNPKNGTITDKPEERKKELESGVTQVKSESKAPLMHVVIGKLSLGEKKLLENLEKLIKAVEPKRIKKLTLASTMSPGIKVDISSIEKNTK